MSTAGVFDRQRIEPFLGVARVPFLLLPVALVAVGAAAAAQTGSLDPTRTVVALIGLAALHVSVNAFNEYSDYERGIDLETEKTPFSGGSGTLPSGEMEPHLAKWMGIVTAGIGLVTGLWFLYVVGVELVPLIVLGAVCVLGYTDLLARNGLGEVAAGLGLGALPVMGVVLIQDGTIGPVGIAAGIPAFFLTFNLLLLNEFPDEVVDRKYGRLNLIHLVGRPRAAWIYVLAAAAVPASIGAAVALEYLPVTALVAVIPAALAVRPSGWAIREPESSVPVEAMGSNVAWVLVTNFALAAGIAAPASTLAVSTELSARGDLFALGRGLFGGVIALMGINNLVDLEGVSEQMAEKGVPYPRVAVVTSSVPLIASALALAAGVYVVPAAAYMIGFLGVATLVVHDFWRIDDPDEQENELFHFLKNVLILAAVVVFLALAGGEWPHAIGL